MFVKLRWLFGLLHRASVESGGVSRGFLLILRRVLEITRMEGFAGLVSRVRKVSTGRVRGFSSSDFARLAEDRQIFTGKEVYKAQAPAKHKNTSHASEVTGAASSSRSSENRCTDVIVCVHNALDDVTACLESVESNTDVPFRLIIVDDGSGEETHRYLSEYARRESVGFIRNETARGYTCAANQGLRASTGEFVVLLNSDTIVAPGWLDALIRCAASETSIGLVGPLSNTASWQSIPKIEENGDWAINSLPKGVDVGLMGEFVAGSSMRIFPKISFLNGFCLFIKRSVMDHIGFFDEDSFAKGYGEENDYCLRARKAGWLLAVADDAYVYHAQSKSYGDERRKMLAKNAALTLERLHGAEIIRKGVEQCRYDRIFMGIRGRSRYLTERQEMVESAPESWRGRRVLFVLPVSESGGGANVVISEARAMQRMGVQVIIVNLARFRPAFEASYQDLDVAVIYLSKPEEIASVVGNDDVVIATANYTVQWLIPLETYLGVILAYYIQDYEVLFYEEDDPQREIAFHSYTLIPRMKLFTKTEWNQRKVHEHTGVTPSVIGPSIDVDLFVPKTQYVVEAAARVRVAAMLRPSSPRRNAAGTVDVLLALQRRFGRAIEVITFGSESHGPPLPDASAALDFVDYGHLSPRETASLLETVDIFIDMSTYQAMGLTAMEAMSCGAVAVVPANGGAESYAKNGFNAVVVDTSNRDSVVDTVAELILDVDRRRSLQERAIYDINRYYPEKAARRTLDYLMTDQSVGHG